MEPSRETLLWETGRLRERIARLRPEQPRLEVFVYYSGHSDEDNLLLGREKVSYRELRAQLQSLAADVRIAILDSCASGAFMRAKGGRQRPPFLFDAAYDMKGFAVMTSSSADEASQESERLRGSFFTHTLVSGLRGAADTSRDGRVTLERSLPVRIRRDPAPDRKDGRRAAASQLQHPDVGHRRRRAHRRAQGRVGPAPRPRRGRPDLHPRPGRCPGHGIPESGRQRKWTWAWTRGATGSSP